MPADTNLTAGRTAYCRALYAAIGAAQGGLLYALGEYGDELIATKSIRIALGVWLASAPTLFLLADQAGRRRAAGVFAGGTGLFVALLYLSVDGRFDGGLGNAMAVFVAAATGISVIELPFFRCWSESGQLRFPYSRLFHHAWNLLHEFVGGWIFVGAVWLVLFLWGRLFKLINIRFFSDLFEESYFALPATGLAFGLAVAILKDWASVIAAARSVVLALLRMLAPVVAGAVALFVLFLPFTGLEPLWDRYSPTTILLAAVAIAVLLINSMIEDDDKSATGNAFLNISAIVLILLLPILVGLAAVAAGLRIDQYGLTPERAHGAILIAIASLYALAYLWSLAAGRRGWRSGVRLLNVRLAAVVALVAVAVCTPALDVQRLSADNQVDRLLSNRVPADAFDFYFVRYRLGIAGKEAVARLRAAEDHADYQQIVAAIDTADEVGNCRGCPEINGEAASALAVLESPAVRVLPDAAEAPAELRAFLAGDDSWGVTSCTGGIQPGCFLVIADLYGDAVPEAVLIDRSSGRVTVYAEDEGGWDRAQWFYMPDTVSGYDVLLDALEAGEFEVVTPSHRTVRSGGIELPITPRH